jgi:hypothetical protein
MSLANPDFCFGQKSMVKWVTEIVAVSEGRFAIARRNGCQDPDEPAVTEIDSGSDHEGYTLRELRAILRFQESSSAKVARLLAPFGNIA